MAKIDELRALAKRSHRNTTKKISRMKHSRGVMVSGSSVDPRRDIRSIDKMTRTQLNTYVQTLGEFNSRGVQFVAGARRRPIPEQAWTEYKRAEKKYNNLIESVREAVKGTKLPSQNMTIGEHFEAMIPKSRSIGGGTMRFWPLERKSMGFPHEKAMRRAIEDMERKLNPNYESEQELRIRDNFDKLLNYSNRQDIRDAADKLTPKEFSLLWNFTPTIRNLVENYTTLRDMLSEKERATEYSGIESTYDDILKDMQAIKGMNKAGTKARKRGKK